MSQPIQPPYGRQPPPGQPPQQPIPYGQQPPFQPQPFQPQPVQPQPGKRKRFGWVALIVTALVSLTIGGMIGNSGDASTTTAQPAPTVTETETVTEEAPDPEPQPTETVTVTAKPKAEPKADTGPSAELAEGTYEVGKDVKAGRYKTTVPDDSMNCYWARLKDDSGDFDAIIANDNASPGARVSVTIKNGEFFENNGCGDWARQ